MRRTAVAVVGVALVGALTTACDPGPECAEYSTTLHTQTTIVNGKPVISTVPVTVCVRYVEPKEDAQ